MGRKRYVTTDISIDDRVRDLAQRSEFAALLYTWMIAHAADDSTITGNPDQLLMLVVPGFRWRTTDDVAEAVGLMLQMGLLLAVDSGRLRFPERAFYKHQAYIKPDRRWPNGSMDFPEPPGNSGKIPEVPETSRESLASSPVNVPFRPSDSSQLLNIRSIQTSHSLDLNGAPEWVGDEIQPVEAESAVVENGAADDDSAESAQIDEVYAAFKASIQPGSRVCPRKKIATRLKRFTVAELCQGIKNFAADEWRMQNNVGGGYDATWFFKSDDQVEKWRTLVPKQAPATNGRANGHVATTAARPELWPTPRRIGRNGSEG